MWEVNKLDAGHSITEHSDLASQDGAQGNLVAKSHKIHIPLITNDQCEFLHRRTVHLPASRQLMPVGHAYAYNNYVWHAVHNNGSEARYQMTIRFWDPEWKDRAQLLKLLGVKNNDAYEECPVDYVKAE
jgi:ectoine hydroxylase-related dioxygenase (phytanoyl-CoA dioxygenase family)